MNYYDAINILQNADDHDDNSVFIAAEIVLEAAKVGRSERHAASVIAEAVKAHRRPSLRVVPPEEVSRTSD